MLARVDAGEPVECGDKTSEGWELMAGLELEAALAIEPAHLWALSAPSRALFVVATGAGSPHPWTLDEVQALADERMRAARLAREFVRAVAAASHEGNAKRLLPREDF